MEKSRGISMISLIVTIIVTITLASMAIVTGSRYLKESKEKHKEVFSTILSNAVLKRKEDASISTSRYPYFGYYIDNDTIFENIFAPKIGNNNISFDDGAWYIIDSNIAAKLDVKGAEEYIDSVVDADDNKVNVALVNYATGDVFLIEAFVDEIAALTLFQ